MLSHSPVILEQWDDGYPAEATIIDFLRTCTKSEDGRIVWVRARCDSGNAEGFASRLESQMKVAADANKSAMGRLMYELAMRGIETIDWSTVALNLFNESA